VYVYYVYIFITIAHYHYVLSTFNVHAKWPPLLRGRSAASGQAIAHR
jgi:hypothetical protein